MPAARKTRKPDIKVVILGDMNVGKTSLLHRYTEKSFKDTLSTVGGAFFLKQWGPYNISIWDTAGREQFHGLGSMYCRGAAAIILTYDVTSWQSLVQLEERFLSLTDSANRDCVFAVVGNKADLTDPWSQVPNTEDTPAGPTPPETPTVYKQVAREDAMALYNRIIRYKAFETHTFPRAEDMCFETSAKTGYNVDALFETLFDLLLPSIMRKQAQATTESATVCLEDCQNGKIKSECCV
ncbi:ras-related protein Rab-20 [Silurus asotus]|uniref:Ras-related protein Rab-20 n=1 Tax=Silurus asotus TaxID=30991 RepID=A0AAD5FK04_SILAS|nr:ras-related protein Rab-20 [Silurus asotus]